MSKDRNKGPVVTIYGQQTRALPDGFLMSMKESLAQEVLFWRGECEARDRAITSKDVELNKSEATVRNQELELRRLRLKINELESR